jgi:ABC-type transport system involved in multi-copper enzyme maturation permease subunit
VTTIVRLTLLEAARRRLLWVLLVLTILSVAITTWGVARLVELADTSSRGLTRFQLELGVSQVLILAAFMFSFVLAMTGAFLAAPAIAGDLESGVALAVLARPIRRADLVVGRWIGLSTVVGLYALAAGLLEVAAVGVVTGYRPPDPLGASVQLAGVGIVLLTIVLALSTRLPAIAAGAVAVVAFGLAWMLGILGGIGQVFGVPALEASATIGRVLLPTDLLWRGTVYALEPPAVILGSGIAGPAAAANPFFASVPLSGLELAWVAAWVVIVLSVAVVSLDRREI